MFRRTLLGAGAALILVPAGSALAVPNVPSQFVVEDVAPGAGFVVPVGIAYFPGGRLLVAEKRGRVYTVVNGVKSATPLWSSENEILNNGDRGLLGIAVDPRYDGTTNRWIYLLYTVDPDSNGNDNDDDAFGRLIRVQVSASDSNVVDYSTRQVLMGINWRQGPVSASSSHTIGALRWGADGSLLVSIGDGAQFSSTDAGGQDPGAFGVNKTDPYEDIGAFRSQYIGSLAGKILRINPDNGLGYPSNPYWDGSGSSVRSRVWVYGLRNPYRFCVRPGTGNPDPAAGQPGSVIIGDVGWTTWEELDVARVGGLNFGWPCFEGFLPQSSYQAASPAHLGCGSIGTPDNPAIQSSPTSAWHHSIDSQSTPPGFHGNTSIGGVFYRSNNYPAQYRNQYFFGDYGQSWVKVAVLDANDNLTQLLDFGSAMDGPVDFNVDPVTGNVVYVAINTQQVRRIRYTGSGGGNTPPVAAMSAVPSTGPAPLAVSFSAAGSTDFDGDPLTYTWVFGDGTSNGSGLTTTHTYASAGNYTAQLVVSDGRGGTDSRTATISATAPGTGFPTTGVLDNFNRPNGAIGGAWVDWLTGLNITNNELTSTGSAASPVWNGAVFGPDQEAYVTLRAITASAPEHDLMLKVQGTSYTAGHIEVRYTAPVGEVQVSTYTAATQWVHRGPPIPVTFSAGDRFGARALADGTVEVFRNGVKIGQASTGDWPYTANGGRLGMTFDGASASRLDDFGGGTVVPAGNTPPVATIQSPINGSFYYTGQTIQLSGSAVDAQTPSGSLSYEWTVDLHHNTHLHPAVFTATGPTASFVAENHDDGTGVWEEIHLTVADPEGLQDTASVNIYPEVDLTPSVVTVVPAAPLAGQSAQFTFELRNLGRMPAPLSHWALRAGGTPIAEGDTLVPALGSVTIVRTASLPAGTYALRARADSLSAVTETDESNNASTVTLVVSPTPNTIPLANAAAVPTGGPAPLLVSFSSAGSSDPDGDPLTFAWAFGDGGTSSAPNPTHTYAGLGTFEAILTLDDGRGGIGRDTVAITVTPPSGAAFPATAVLDDFNRANATLGSPWLGVTGLSVSSSQLRPTKRNTDAAWGGATYGPDQEAYLTLATLSGGNEYALRLKMQGTSHRDGCIEVSYQPGLAGVQVSSYTPGGGGWTTFGVVAATFAAGDRFGARALANGTVTVYRNGTALGVVAVASFAGSGGGLGVAFTAATASALDDFGGGNAPAASAGAVPAAARAPAVEPAEPAPRAPASLELGAAWPNPSRGGIRLALELPGSAEVGFTVHDVQGRVVWREAPRPMGPGRWTLSWDGRGEAGALAPGIYVVRVRVGDRVLVRRALLVR